MMPILSKPWIIVSALIYLGVVFAIGVWAARRTRNARDFFIAGQKIGLLVTALATMTASYSGFVFLGGPGLTYSLGTASFFICVSVSFTAGLLCWTVAKRLRLMSEVRDIYTVPDAFYHRFDSRLTSGLAAAGLLVGTIGYLGVQFRALGVLIEAIFGTRDYFGQASPWVAMAVGVSVILFYSVAGGMIAGVYTDLFQGFLMMLAAMAVFVTALSQAGGPAMLVESIRTSRQFGPDFLNPLGTVPVMTGLGFFFVFSIGTLGQPHMLHKFYMLDDPRKLKWMPLMIGGSQTLCVLIWMGIGLAVPALVAQGRMEALTRPDDAAPAFLLQFAPEVLAGLVFAGILAAIMSTADSFLSIGSAALVRDVPLALRRPLKDELRAGRLAVVFIALAAALFSYFYGDLIALLGTFAFGTFAAALGPALAVGLNWKRVPARAATASILTGLVLNLGLELANRAQLLPLAPGVLPSAVALAASFTVLFAVTYLSPPPQPPRPDMEAVMDA
ncbi:MAG TPA: sodium/proline symporter [Acidobacteriota bacterium]|nr:sodium/proline symporter [Acidobacteriota bacterium]